MWVTQMYFSLPVPRPTVKIVSDPINAPHHTGFDLNLVCTSLIDQAVDTGVTVTHTWSRCPKAGRTWNIIRNSSRITVFPVFGEKPEFKSLLEFSPLQRSDDSIYSCESTVYPAPDNPKYQYLFKSDEEPVKIPFDISPRKLSMDPLYISNVFVHGWYIYYTNHVRSS